MITEGFNITDKINAVAANIRKELSGYPSLVELNRQITVIPEKMREPMQLAIVGKISSSKSTLVNAILGEAEVVRTGDMEETWNVSWLKYGEPNSQIVVHYKDANRSPEKVERSQWAEWANRDRESNDQLKNAVSYIEVAYPHPILKQINIIDTPGLDSFYGADSQNTLDFLKQVKPDAVIMLFSKSINADTLSVIEDFRQGIGSGFSPVNAIGVMSKIDDIWASDPDKEPIEVSNRIIGRLMTLEAVKNTLFNIFPVSALIALAGSRITEQDMATLRNLSRLPDEVLYRIFMTESRFTSTDYDDVPVSAKQRDGLASVYGRYGAWLMVRRLKEAPQTGITELKELLFCKSGFHNFMEKLENHFGQRSAFIKAYSLTGGFSENLRKASNELADISEEKWVVGKTIHEMEELKRILKVQSGVIDIAEEYYEGKLRITPEEFEEIRRLNGEYGYSCIERTGLNANATPKEMINVCKERIGYWRTQFNTKGKARPSLAPFMKQMISLYSILLEDIISAKHRIEYSSKFLFGK